MKLRFFILFSLLFGGVSGQDFIIADFSTSEGDFSVALDYVNAPLACANFIQLAGKGDDILETVDGVPLVNEFGHSNQFYRSTVLSDAQRLPLTVRFLAATETTPEQYGVFQSNTYLGGVEILSGPGFHADVTGQDRIRLSVLSFFPVRYRITLRYPRTWVNARDQTLRDAPMYSVIPINRVESGRRFFAGSLTTSLLELPGYYFQHENINSTPFNSPYILAMDSLSANRNGSRFFVTSVADPSLNGKHTAFGTVLQDPGRLVVRNITGALTNATQEPDTEMFVFGITFRRNGVTAQAFFEGFHQSFIPGDIKGVQFAIERTGPQLALVTPALPSSLISFYTSTDLITFNGGAIEGRPPLLGDATETDLTETVSFSPRFFVRGYAADVPVWPSAEVDLTNSQFTLRANSSGDSGFVTLTFLEQEEVDGVVAIGGIYAINMQITQTVGDEEFVVLSQGTGVFSATYDFSVGPYEGTLDLTDGTGNLNVEQIKLQFEAGLVRSFSANTTSPEVTFLNYSGTYQQIR